MVVVESVESLVVFIGSIERRDGERREKVEVLAAEEEGQGWKVRRWKKREKGLGG